MEKKRNEIRDCNFERDTGFIELTKRDSRNVILKGRDPGCPGRKCTNTIKLSSSGMSEIDQQKATTQSGGYCDPYGGRSAKEGLKRTTHWAAHYFTNPKSRYPVPEHAMVLSAMPVMQPLPPVPMPQQCVQSMRDWAPTFSAAVRQRYVRQETTMARAGTLPSYLYQREVQPGE